MGQLIDLQQWLQGSGRDHRDLIDALQRELERGSEYSLEHQRWFDAGRSGSPVASVIRRDPNVDHRILKFCTERQATQLRRALTVRNDFVRQHLTKVEKGAIDLGGGWRAVFMRVAGDNLEALWSLKDLRKKGRSIDYHKIVKSVVGEWNEGEPQPEARSVRSVVGGIVGHRRSRALRWIRKVDDGLDAGPVSLLAGDAGRRLIPGLFVGHAHGDLNTRNILIPAVPSVKSADFQLIDYDHFNDKAVLARDPMHLLVAMALDDFDGRPCERAEIIKAIVDPDQDGLSGNVRDFADLSRAVHSACAASFPKRKGFAGHWREQCLLALVGVALRHVGRDPRTNDPEEARRWCYDLAMAAAKSFTEIQNERKGSVPGTPSTGLQIIDRFHEREALADRLTYGPYGVVSVEGERGVGKTKLIDVVIGSLSAKSGNEHPPRVHRLRATADRRLDLRTLVELISGGEEPARRGSELVLLESALDRLKDTPVVVTVENAENLLDDHTHQVDDPNLADAFDMLDAEPGHRVSVVLETRHGAVLSAVPSWPDDPVVVPALAQFDFLDLLREVDPRIGRYLNVSDAELRNLRDYAEGNAHIGVLVCAAVCEAGVMTLPELIASLRDHRHRPAAHLIELLLQGAPGLRTNARRRLPPISRGVLQALAVCRTPVPVEAVMELVPRSRQVLKNLVDRHLVRRQGRLYWLSPADADTIVELIPEPDRSQLYFDAAEVLEAYRAEDPRSVEDLRYHLAELECLLDAEEYPSALELITELDDGWLKKWNCSTRLRRQRERVRAGIRDPKLTSSNETALGGIYVALGKLDLAGIAYGRALKLAGPDAAPKVAAALHADLAAMQWAANDVDLAQSNFEYALEKAKEARNPEAMSASLTGLADCHRRRGEFTDAIDRATEAYEISSSADFGETSADADGRTTAVGLAARLSRWHAEQEDLGKAHQWLEKARLLAKGGEDWHRAVYLDGLADLRLVERLADGKVVEVVAAARDAAELAHRVHDRAVLLQARTTLCVAYLRAGRFPEAAQEIVRADRYRGKGRHLIVHGLLALTARLTGDRRAAGRHFDKLLEEAEARIALDIGIRDTIGGLRIESGPGDFGARHMRGLAQCGLAVEGRGDVEAAVRSFRMRDLPRRPHAPGLVTRLVFLLKTLEPPDGHPGLLEPAIRALEDP
ncbi:tetratricopeptide repeat protein [Paractinoplanes brasiliensis]|uniref:Tetratricopeptide repeat protein n=1 Tax=Paractinoplanes brasiliensis TaxID=52695 RepID=A0A4R6K131_9ACTN|nr:tetratricopeptide repeat protein [Actinoplanes brasiliensis]TDO41781.1 tetratricopeptide repeat protein [Actinoplanes brasiliensis]GID29953.1 hypothetical protein Abr02nite_49360 [Actinoplanes brasiliensis]